MSSQNNDRQLKFNKSMFFDMDINMANRIIDYTRGSSCEIDWKDFATNMNYIHRWVVKKQSLPAVIKMKIINWIRGDPYNKIHEPIAVALEKDNPKLLLPNED